MVWEENSCISLNMQLIAILSRIGVVTCEVVVIPKYPTFRYDIELSLWHLKKKTFSKTVKL